MQPRFASLALAFLLSTHASAQMSGGYTINPTGTGTRNFKTFLEAGKALFAQGVSGPVLIIASPGTYTESFFLLPVTGASSTNTITFQSLLPGLAKLTGAPADTLVMYAGLSWYPNGWYVMDGFDFVTAPGAAIRAGEYTSDVEVRNCTFRAAHTGGTTQRALIYVNGANTNTRWNVHHNKFTMPNNIQGLYGSQITAWAFHHNDVDINAGNQTIYLINNNTALNRIYNNLFYGAQGTSTSSGVVNVDLSNLNNDICNNTFYVATSGGSLVRTFGSSGNFNRIYANVMAITGAGNCVNVTNSSLAFWDSDSNDYWAPNGNVGSVSTTAGVVAYPTLTAWQVGTGKDATSISADPMFLNTTATPPNLHVLPISPVKDASVKTPSFVVDDYDGRYRDAKPDIGAYELNGFATYGTGCAGTGAAVPKIGSTGNANLGSTNFAVTLSQALGGAPGGLMIGASNTSYSGIPLPYSLGGGCSLLLAPSVLIGIVTTGSGGGNGAFSIPLLIPNNSALYGKTTYVGWVVVDPAAANQFGITTSDAGAVQL